jgi:hypothetical protein
MTRPELPLNSPVAAGSIRRRRHGNLTATVAEGVEPRDTSPRKPVGFRGLLSARRAGDGTAFRELVDVWLPAQVPPGLAAEVRAALEDALQ